MLSGYVMGSILESALNPPKWCAPKAGTLLAGVLGDNFGCDAWMWVIKLYEIHTPRNTSSLEVIFCSPEICRLKVCLVELQAKGAHPPGIPGCHGRVTWLQGNSRNGVRKK